MRWTHTLIPTLREAPADAEIVSHKLLLRAGLIRKLAGGVYTFLPLGLRALRKVEQIVREEMDRAGAIEVLMPALQPPEIWEQSGRAETASNVLFKVKDSSGRAVVFESHRRGSHHHARGERNQFLPPVAEEFLPDQREVPRRNPPALRIDAREGIHHEGRLFVRHHGRRRDGGYKKMYDAYTRIFARCGLKAFPVEADTGVIGGNYSHEFMVPAETGENEVAFCEACGYAANIEKATSGIPKTAAREIGAAIEKFATPGVVTIEALSKEPYKVPANRQIKTLVYIADSKPVIILIRGDDQLNETKFLAKTGAVAARPATVEEIVPLLGAKPGVR